MPSKGWLPIQADLTLQEKDGANKEQGVSIKTANIYNSLVISTVDSFVRFL